MTRPTGDAAQKVDRPHAHFDQPESVVTDRSLSKDEKIHALENLEQDARQMGVASAEGMAGGEETGLHEVLVAKDAIEPPQNEAAIAVVMQYFRSRLAETEGTEAYRLIEHAIQAIDAVRDALKAPHKTHDAKAELETELAMEKLDP